MSAVQLPLIPESLLVDLDSPEHRAEHRWAVRHFNRLLHDYLAEHAEDFADYSYQKAREAIEAENTFNAEVDRQYEATRSERA